MNKLDFLILFLHNLTGNDEWMTGNKLNTASAYYGNYEQLLEMLKNNNSSYNLENDKNYFYQHLNTTEDHLKTLDSYTIEYEGDFSRGLSLVGVDLGFGETVKILQREESDIYYVNFNPKKLYGELIDLRSEYTRNREEEASSDNHTTGEHKETDSSSEALKRGNDHIIMGSLGLALGCILGYYLHKNRDI